MERSRFFAALVEPLKIWLACVCAAVCYGIVHDQVTVRFCLEYFTIGHPLIFPTTNPTLLALGWGVIATWWAGALLGLPTIIVMRAGRRPAWHVRQLLRPLCIYLACVGVAACLAGTVGYALASTGAVKLPQITAVQLPSAVLDSFIAVAWVHETSYAAGGLGALLVWRWIWRQRANRGGAAAPSRRRVVLRASGVLLVTLLWCGFLYIEHTGIQTFNDLYFPAEQAR
jgi:hypothetical protein